MWYLYFRVIEVKVYDIGVIFNQKKLYKGQY